MKIFVVGGLVSRELGGASEEAKVLERACWQLGVSVAAAGHEIVLCSPFEDAADIHVLRGAASTAEGRDAQFAFHYVDTPVVSKRLDAVLAELRLARVSRIPHPPPQEDNQQSRRYAWLLCQLNAQESSHATIAVGGDPNGAANMLLLLADGKRKAVLPFAFMGGAAKLAFDRRRYELEDRLGPSSFRLQREDGVSGVSELLERLAQATGNSTRHRRQEAPNFFISYARDRQGEADYVEMLLRRRNLLVFRDESDFGAGHAIPTAIREAIYEADVFIALWSSEYACSPWCFDEMELALDRHAGACLDLWILRVDATRIVPKRARDLVFYDAPTRAALEARVVGLLERRMARVSE